MNSYEETTADPAYVNFDPPTSTPTHGSPMQ
jgi:hypothetical protein